MRRFILLIATTLVVLAGHAQTLHVNLGNVGYAIPAADAGEMVYTGGTAITIGGRTYALSEITSMNIDNAAVSDNTVAVAYNGSSASVTIAGNLAPYVEATVDGAHVTVLANASLASEVTYTLSGSSSGGSFYMDGKYPATFVLNGLTLTCADSAAVNIQDGKLITMLLADGTTNALADGITGTDDGTTDSHKAPLVINGHSSWSGSGSLTLTGNVKHGYFSDEYTVLNSGLGTITVERAVGDGFHVNEYFQMKGGTVSIAASGDGIDVGLKGSSTSARNGMMLLEGGTLTVETSGAAYKALKCDSTMTVSGGIVTATTTGAPAYDTAKADLSSCAAAKCALFSMTGGTMNLTSTGAGGKGLNCDGNITVSGGTLTVVTTGTLYTYSATLDSKPQGIKTDASIYLNGGTVLSAAGDANGSASPLKASAVYTNGATVMGIGAKAVTPSSASTAGYKKYTGVSVTGGSTLTYNGVSFAVPAAYSNTSAKVIVSSASM